MECDPHWYMRNEPQTGHACLTDSADPAKPCRIGATSTCVDGQPAVCTPGQAFCVPSIACATAACQTDPLSTACLGDPTGFASAAHVDCTIPIIHNSVSGTDSTCATSSMQSTLDGSALFTNGCSWKWISFPAQLPPSLDDQLDLGIPNQLVGSLTVVGSGIPRFVHAVARALAHGSIAAAVQHAVRARRIRRA